MDELQLRMSVHDVTLIADAMERDMSDDPNHPNRVDLERILAWLRYRLSRRATAAAAVTPE